MLVYPNPPCRARVTTASHSLPICPHVPRSLPLLLWWHHLFQGPTLCFPSSFPPPSWSLSLLSHQPLVPLPAQSLGLPMAPVPSVGSSRNLLRRGMGRNGPVWPLLLGLQELRHERLEGQEYGDPIGR